jgi:hypothetical protein
MCVSLERRKDRTGGRGSQPIAVDRSKFSPVTNLAIFVTDLHQQFIPLRAATRRVRRFRKNCVLFAIAPRRSISYRRLRQENIAETFERRSTGLAGVRPIKVFKEADQ